MPTPKASLELPPQLKWTFANEPKILEWSIKARNYNTKVANSLFTIMLFVTFGLSLFLYSAYHDLDQVWRISACATFFILTTLTASLMTHQKMNFAYRLTNTGIEYCKWKTLPKLTKKSLMYLATITNNFNFPSNNWPLSSGGSFSRPRRHGINIPLNAKL